MEEKIYLASNLRYLRKMHQKTQEQIAMICNKKNTAISNWEKGIREPEALDLITLAKYFNVSVDDLILRDLSKNNNNSIFNDWSESKNQKNFNIFNNISKLINSLPDNIIDYLDLEFQYSVLIDEEYAFGLYNYSNLTELYQELLNSNYIIDDEILSQDKIEKIIEYIESNKEELLNKLNLKKNDILKKVNEFKNSPYYEKYLEKENVFNDILKMLKNSNK